MGQFKNWRLGVEKMKELNNAQREKVAKTAVGALQRQSTNKQVSFLSGALAEGRLSPGRLLQLLEDNAYKEIRKGADKLVKQGKTPTVDLLLAEYHKEKDFKKLAASVGLDESWFVNLAKEECARGEK